MAVSRVTCPECEASLQLARPVEAGKKIRCSECNSVITVVEEKSAAAKARALADDKAATARSRKEQDKAKSKDADADPDAKAPSRGAVTREAPRKEAAKPAPKAAAKAAAPPAAKSPEKKKDEDGKKDAGGKPADGGKKADADDEGGTYSFLEDDKPKVEEAAPKKKKKKRDDDDEDDEDDEDEDEKEDDPTSINYGQDTSIKDLRGPAVEALVQPTNKLIMAGSIGFFGWLGIIALLLVPFLFPLQDDLGTKESPIKVRGIGKGLGGVNDAEDPKLSDADKEADKKEKERPMFAIGPVPGAGVDCAYLSQYEWYVFIPCIILPLMLGALYSAIMTYGAVKAQSLESHGWGMAASIMGMIPISPFGFIVFIMFFMDIPIYMILDDGQGWVELVWLVACMGLQMAVGLWTLLVLMQPEVIEGFEYVPEG